MSDRNNPIATAYDAALKRANLDDERLCARTGLPIARLERALAAGRACPWVAHALAQVLGGTPESWRALNPAKAPLPISARTTAAGTVLRFMVTTN